MVNQDRAEPWAEPPEMGTATGQAAAGATPTAPLAERGGHWMSRLHEDQREPGRGARRTVGLQDAALQASGAQ